jgi:L-ribulose-5-phosphate 3-epimerase
MVGYFLGLYEKAMPETLSMKEKMIEAKNSDYDFLEISIDETDEKLKRLKWDKNKKLDLIKASIETGIKVMSMCLSAHRKYPIGSEDGKIRNRGMLLILLSILEYGLFKLLDMMNIISLLMKIPNNFF